MIPFCPHLTWMSVVRRKTVQTIYSRRDRSEWRWTSVEAVLRRFRKAASRLFGFWSDGPDADVPSNRPAALAIIGPGQVHDQLVSAFAQAGWILVTADSLQSALTCLSQHAAPIVFCERASGNHTEKDATTWRQTVAELSRLSPRPYIVLLSAHSDKNLWDEFGRCGGSQILRLPLEHDSVICTVHSGWALWRNQQEVRLAGSSRV